MISDMAGVASKPNDSKISTLKSLSPVGLIMVRFSGTDKDAVK